MATVSSTVAPEVVYPTSDGRPMAETDVHRDDMTDTIKTLQARYANDPMIYVSGNLLVFYEKGNNRKHLSPDVFVVRGVEKRRRDNYLIWQEGKNPEWVTEFTSKSTRTEDIKDKFDLYRDVLKVQEYFLFDPYGDYLDPPLQGFRIEPVDGRLPSEVLGLHLEGDGWRLRLFDPATGRYLPTPEEAAAEADSARQQEAAARQQAEAAQRLEVVARQQAETAQQQEAAARQQAEAARQQEAAARQQAEAAQQQARAELEQLRRELEAYRRNPLKNT